MSERLVRMLFAPDAGDIWGPRGGPDVREACLKARLAIRDAGFDGCIHVREVGEEKMEELFKRSDGKPGIGTMAEQYAAVGAYAKSHNIVIVLITTSAGLLTLASQRPIPGVVVPNLADFINGDGRRRYFERRMPSRTKVEIVNYVRSNADKLYLIATGKLLMSARAGRPAESTFSNSNRGATHFGQQLSRPVRSA